MQDPFSSRRRWTDRYRSALGRLVQSISLALGLVLYHSVCFFLSHPRPLNVLFAALRRTRPIAVVGRTVLVTKASDVREVLERFDDFTLAEVLGPRMPWGPFLLSLDWREQHARDRSMLQSAVSVSDISWIRDIAATKCQKLLAQACMPHPQRGEIDIVAGVSEPVVVKVAETYFGIPALDNERGMVRILCNLAGVVMVEPPAESERWIEARHCIAEFTENLVSLIEAKRRAIAMAATIPAFDDDILTRLVKRLCAADPSWLDEDWIRRHVTGLATTGGATIVRAVTHAVDQLLAHPAELRKACALAARLEQDTAELVASDQSFAKAEQEATRHRVEDTRQGLRQIVYEALRFRPMLPLLVRYSPRRTMIGKGTARARMVPAGAHVLAPPLAAMCDPEVFERPWRFRSTRPLGDYLHFGCGPRTCLGKHVADTVMIEIIRRLLLLPGLERAAGQRGRVAYDGPVVRSLTLTFDRNGRVGAMGKE